MDELPNPILSDVAKVDWEPHLPKMSAFLNGMILGKLGYTGRPFPRHAILPLGREYFEQWLSLFKETVGAHFSGARADRAKNAAASIAHPLPPGWD